MKFNLNGDALSQVYGAWIKRLGAAQAVDVSKGTAEGRAAWMRQPDGSYVVVCQSLSDTIIQCTLDSVVTTLDGQGANQVVAGDNDWAAYLFGVTRTSWKLQTPTWAMDCGGSRVFTTDFSDLLGFDPVSTDPTAPALRLVGVRPQIIDPYACLSCLDPNRFIYKSLASNSWRGYGVPDPVLPAWVGTPLLMAVADLGVNGLWVFYTVYPNNVPTAIAQPLLGGDGYMFTAPYINGANCVGLNGLLLLGWGTGQGEDGPDGMHVEAPIDVTVVPRVPIVEPAPVPDLPPLNHRVTIAPFVDVHSAAMPLTDGCIGIGTRTSGIDQPQVFVGAASAAVVPPAQLAGIFTEADDISADLAVALQYQTRVAWLHDGTVFTPPPANLRPACDLVIIECYLVQGESADQSAIRWHATITQMLDLWPGQLGVCGLGYTQFLWTEQQVLDCQPVYNALVNTSERIVLLSDFCFGRANAIATLPQVLAKQMASSPGAAVLNPVPQAQGSVLARYVAAGLI